MATLTTTTRKVLAVASLAAIGLASPAIADPIKIGGQKGPLQIGKNGSTNFHGNGRPAPLAQHGGFKPGYGGSGAGYKPGYGYGGGYKKYGYGGPGWGYGAAAMGGLAVGMIAASAASASSAYDEGGCYVRRRWAVDEEGNQYIRRVRVCE